MIWIPIASVLAIHDRQLKLYGGAQGVRDMALLESALARPETLAHYETPSLELLAATYTDGIVRNHPFVDANKRTAFVTGMAFMLANGVYVSRPEAETVKVVVGLAERKMTVEDYAEWLSDE